MDVLTKIKHLRDHRGWTDYQLSKASGVSHGTISNLFKRNNLPTLPTLEALCKGFGMTLAQFFAIGGDLEARSEEHRELLVCWDMLTPDEKSAFMTLMKRHCTREN